MDINQSTELSYVKINEIDTKVNEILDMVTDSNPESSNSLKELSNQIITNTENIEEKVNSVIEAVNNTPEIDTTGLENKINETNNNIISSYESISQINTNVSAISQNITSMSSDITTTNSNVATNKSNITNIKTSIDNIEDKMATEQQSKVLDGKLNEVLRLLRQSNYIEDFAEDPYKLQLPYTGRIEINRNPSNYDYFENTKEFSTFDYIYCCAAHCTGDTFSYNAMFTFTCTEKTLIKVLHKGGTTNKYYEAGTHTVDVKIENVATNKNRAYIHLTTDKTIIVHYVKLELFGENIIIVPKKKKHKVNFAPNKLIISKVNNNNGYCLVIDDFNSLHPSNLQQEYTLKVENVLDFDMGYDHSNYLGKKYSYEPCFAYISENYKYYADYANGYNKQYVAFNANKSCDFGRYNNQYNLFSSIVNTFDTDSYFYTYKLSNTGNFKEYLTFKYGYLSECVFVKDYTLFNNKAPLVYVATLIDGTNFIFTNNTTFLDIGYGKNVTAYYHPDNMYKMNIYMNDGGYCVKKVVEISEDLTQFTLLSQSIIGTYDAYFETPSDVYLVEKNENLYMYKSNS